jgi:hypothetical protein
VTWARGVLLIHANPAYACLLYVESPAFSKNNTVLFFAFDVGLGLIGTLWYRALSITKMLCGGRFVTLVTASMFYNQPLPFRQGQAGL